MSGRSVHEAAGSMDHPASRNSSVSSPPIGRGRICGMCLRRAGLIALLATSALAMSSVPQAAAAGSCSSAGADKWEGDRGEQRLV